MTDLRRAGAVLGIALALAAMGAAWWSLRPTEEDATSLSPLEGPGGAQPTSGLPGAGSAVATELPAELLLLDLPPLDPRDDGESREVVAFARDAGLGKVASLERMLLAQQPLVVGNAVRALGRLGLFSPDSKYADLLTDPRARVRQEAVRALGLCGDARAAALLETVLATGSVDERRLALQALGELGGTPAIEVLNRIVPVDSTERVFQKAALESAARSTRESSE